MKRGIEMNYAEIKNFDIANGLGVRVSLLYQDARITVRIVLIK